LVTTLTWAPELRPYSAEKFEVWILNLLDKVESDIVNLTGIAACLKVRAAINRHVGHLPRLPLTDAVLVARLVLSSNWSSVVSATPGNQRKQLHVVAAIQGQALHLLAIDHARDLARSCIYCLAGNGRNLHRLGYLPRLQRKNRSSGAHLPLREHRLLRRLKPVRTASTE